MTRPKLLLTSVFGPYGVSDGYAEGTGMQMELLNNQVTREQGPHSPRVAGTFTYGLYLIAKNISVPTVVLDFPRWSDFVAELRNGYTHVGIAFIVPNVEKARRMTRYIREHYPAIKIVLGGAGAVLPGLRDVVPCDEICDGEGIAWMRRYFGEDVSKPIVSPAVTGEIHTYYFGVKVREVSSQIFPGVGCINACDFCHTTHFFKTRYTPFIKTGKALFDVCRDEAEQFGVSTFVLVDENFMKDKQRAIELLAELEQRGKPYSFCIFSSAEAIIEMGVDFLVRLGVTFVWIGLESKFGGYKKLRDVDLHALIADLRDHGIRVLGSLILFLDHHDDKTLQDDIDWAIGLKTDFLQFMSLCIVPGTALYRRYLHEKRLIEGFPPRKMTGAGELWFRHPHFSASASGDILREAFRKSYRVNGPCTLAVTETMLRGYLRNRDDAARRRRDGLVWDAERSRYRQHDTPRPDTFMEMRLEAMRTAALEHRRVLLAAWLYAPNRTARRHAARLMRRYRETFGKMSHVERLQASAMALMGGVELARITARRTAGREELVRQPFLRRSEYNTAGLVSARGDTMPSPLSLLRRAPQRLARGAKRLAGGPLDKLVSELVHALRGRGVGGPG